MLGKPAPTASRPPVEVEPGPSCPPEIFNEFQMDVRDPGPGSAPRLQARGQLIQDQAAGGWGEGPPWHATNRGRKDKRAGIQKIIQQHRRVRRRNPGGESNQSTASPVSGEQERRGITSCDGNQHRVNQNQKRQTLLLLSGPPWENGPESLWNIGLPITLTSEAAAELRDPAEQVCFLLLTERISVSQRTAIIQTSPINEPQQLLAANDASRAMLAE